jgi:arginine deiminase
MLESRRLAARPPVMSIRVDSEIGRLRRVLLHRPGQEIDRMVPTMMEELLFDDILDGETAREEHDGFRRLLELAGVETLDARELLVEVLADGDLRRHLVERLCGGRAGGHLAGRLAELAPAALADAAISGLRAAAPAASSPFDLPPVPNYFFQRDPQAVVGDQVVIGSMATAAREREPLLARLLFDNHPALAGHRALFEVEHPARRPAGWPPRSHYPTLEGGDLLVADGDTLLIGVSERTNRRGVEVLAEHLRAAASPPRHLLLVDLPPRRAYMHLDTVFTFIDRGLCLAHLPVIGGDGMEAAAVYQVDLTARELTFTLRPPLPTTLRRLGCDLEVVPCGGAADRVDQEREQWTDGANAFAVAPGVIFLYRRNRRTLDELDRRGWRIVGEEEILARGEVLVGEGPTAITLVGNELSRARGGPRCMAMPLERDSL